MVSISTTITTTTSWCLYRTERDCSVDVTVSDPVSKNSEVAVTTDDTEWGFGDSDDESWLDDSLSTLTSTKDPIHQLVYKSLYISIYIYHFIYINIYIYIY